MTKKYISVLNVLSAFAVVILHINSCFWEFSHDGYWFSANIIESVMYFAVPVFFMISGATLIDYRERYSTKVYLRKRIEKTVIPFVTWSVVALLLMTAFGKVAFSKLFFGDLKKGFELIINAEILDIYWFFVALFGVYLCVPVLSAIDKRIRKKVFTYIAIGSFMVNYLVPFLAEILDIDYHNRVTMDVGIGYLLYVVVGYLLSEYELKDNMKLIIYILSAMGLLMHVVGTYCLSIEENVIVETFKGYTNVPAFLYSVGVFVFVKDVVSKNESRLLITICDKVLSKYTFAVYLLHLYFIKGIDMIAEMNKYSLCYRLTMPFFVFLMCVCSIWLLRKIPGVRKILP